MKHLLLLLTLCSVLSSNAVFGQGAFPGFEGIAWGSDITTVSNKVLSAGQDRRLKGKDTPSTVAWNRNEFARVSEFKIGPPTMVLYFLGKYNEEIRCFFSNNQLGMIIYTPPGQLVFAPNKLIAQMDAAYETIAPKKRRKDVAMPIDWGRVDPKMEYLEVLDWENNDGLARVFCKSWPVADRRQVFKVIYTSKAIAALSDQLIAAEEARIAAEIAAKEAERLRELEERQRQQEEAAKAAAAAAAAGTPAP